MTSRRILLIDADPEFWAFLTQQLADYWFDVLVMPELDEAVELAKTDPPALVLLAVEEPAKLGFKAFTPFKKPALARIPLIITTRSLLPKSVADHRKLVVHAHDYLDKRTVGPDELLRSIDELIGLGPLRSVDPDDEPVDDPVVPMGDADNVWISTQVIAENEQLLREAQRARLALETRLADAEHQRAETAAQVGSLEARERALEDQLASLQHDLEHKQQALAKLESVRTRLDRDLASEAARAASASDVERALRAEQEQLTAKHQGELATLRQMHSSALAIAREKLRQELGVAHAAAIAKEQAAASDTTQQQLEALRQRHAIAMEAVRQEHTVAIEAVRAELAARLGAAVGIVRDQVAGEAEISTRQLAAQHANELARLRDERDEAIAAATAQGRAIADITEKLERARAELAGMLKAHADTISQRAKQYAELAAQADQHASTMTVRERELIAAQQADAIAQAAAIAELKLELERQAELHDIQLAGAKRELDDAVARHEQAKTLLLADHKRISAERSAIVWTAAASRPSRRSSSPRARSTSAAACALALAASSRAVSSARSCTARCSPSVRPCASSAVSRSAW